MGQLKFFTFLAHEEIDAIEREHRASPEKRTAQRRLAQELTRFVHGAEELQKAEASASALFHEKTYGSHARRNLECVRNRSAHRNYVCRLRNSDRASGTARRSSRTHGTRAFEGSGP